MMTVQINERGVYMVGSGLKKLAQEYGMQVASGVAYGSMEGFATTFSEGSGYKQIVITTTFSEAGSADTLQAILNTRNISREFRVQKLNIAPNGINIVFHDNPGTMKKIRDFLNWFLPKLKHSSATGYQVCTECGCEVTEGLWVLINNVAFYMHDSCAQAAERNIIEEEDAAKRADMGSYATGTIGALLGAAIGAVVWALVLLMGYVASVVGLLIGWLAERGYNLFRGKQGKAKVLILIIAIILGVLLGTFAADAITVASMIGNGELPGIVYGDIVPMIIFMLSEDAAYAGATMSNILMGLLFAALGVFALLRKTNKDVSGTKFVYLD
jgi:hypothetical protein